MENAFAHPDLPRMTIRVRRAGPNRPSRVAVVFGWVADTRSERGETSEKPPHSWCVMGLRDSHEVYGVGW